MANHGYVITEVEVSNRLKKMLDEINEHRFENKLKIKQFEDDSYFIEIVNGFGPVIWVNDEGQIEIRHCDVGDISWWVDCILHHELAVKVNGYIADDGHEDECDGELNKYPTFLSYIHKKYNYSPNPLIKNFLLRMSYKDASSIRPDLVRIGIK